MGCGSSNDTPPPVAVAPEPEPEPEVFDIKVNVGDNVKLPPKKSTAPGATGPAVVMLFGGPATQKGLIVEKLHDEYRFQVLSAENLILKRMRQEAEVEAKRAAKRRKQQGEEVEEGKEEEKLGTKQLFSQLKTNEKLTLKWVLDICKEEILKPENAGVPGWVVDILPNHKNLLRNEEYITDAAAVLEEFENADANFKVAFALDLYLSESEFAETIARAEAKKAAPKADADAATGGEKKEEKTSDEADKGKTKRRYQAYTSASKPCLDYFRGSGRVVKISCNAPHELVWEQVKAIFQRLNQKQRHRAHTLVLFAFNGLLAGDGVDLTQLGLNVVNMPKLIDEERESGSELAASLPAAGGDVPVKDTLAVLKKHVKEHNDAVGFVVDVGGLQLDKTSIAKGDDSQIMFHNSDLFGLSSFLPKAMDRASAKKADSIMFQAVTTTDNLFLAFPDSADRELCWLMALALSKLA